MRRLRAALAWLVSLFDLRDVLVFGGLGSLGYGVAQFNAPAAWMVVGGILFLLGLRR